MTRCVVEIYGLSDEITDLHQIELDIENVTCLGDIIGALRRKVPALEGEVIRAGEDRLTRRYAFNVNGHFYFDRREKLELQAGDRIALLTLPTGG